VELLLLVCRGSGIVMLLLPPPLPPLLHRRGCILEQIAHRSIQLPAAATTTIAAAAVAAGDARPAPVVSR
jgi:hypothetical protein